MYVRTKQILDGLALSMVNPFKMKFVLYFCHSVAKLIRGKLNSGSQQDDPIAKRFNRKT